jgi:hypothetical protein
LALDINKLTNVIDDISLKRVETCELVVCELGGKTLGNGGEYSTMNN